MPEPQTGRIGGGVLKDNLLRNGHDLNFKNQVSDVPILHLDVNNMRIGVNNDAPDFDLELPTDLQSTDLISTTTSIDTFDIANSAINYFTGSNMSLTAGQTIEATSIATDNLLLDYNTISTRTTNTNIELRPAGAGTVDIYSDWDITGALHSTGNIVFGGNLTLGDSDEDDVTFEADLNSDLIPDVGNTSKLGSSTKKWLETYTKSLYSDIIYSDRIVMTSGGDLQARSGNIFYVSTLGNNTNVGDHQHGAFRTLAHALSQVDASSGGPVTIHIYPGEYEEIFPLVVPERVTIRGHDLRNVIIKPTAATNTNNAFELNQNCMVTDVTIKDFYSPGYAFTFAADAIITDRSPYIQNITVITKGSVTSASDPRGFAQGDAGKGALIDGSVVNAATTNPSMLFHAATFITPGVDAITMTNGVRVEWLNSFTYFANIGLHALQGTLGKANDGTTFGAEIRSIGSASVYGNKGAEANGTDTLMYLIGHNFAYIGTGKDVTNDKTLTVEANEITELNLGKIYNVSTDATGKFKVGDSFFADYDTGSTSLAIDSANFSGLSQIQIRDNFDVTYLDGLRIDTGSIRLTGNTVTTTDSELEIKPTTGILNLSTNPGLVLSNGPDIDRTDVTGSVRYNTDSSLFEGYAATGNISFGGIYSDDRQTSVDAHPTNNSILFRSNNVLQATLDSTTLSLNSLSSGDIMFSNNLITTTDSNSDLDLRSNGTGKLVLDDLTIKNATIENTSNNNVIVESTGLGYVKFDSTTGLVVPFGNTASQTPTPTLGETRWNTDEAYLETYNGEDWQRSAGEDGTVNDQTIRDLVDLYIMVLG
tara:strand:+ start:2687 stop:5146 length:2460 start_codon:yes stop_codon:yes gene_type:complete